MIIDSHSLNSLSGLNNLNRIHGNNLYLDTYSVVIRNNNFIDQNYTGLCYANNINWTLLTDHLVLINNNNDNCSCNQNVMDVGILDLIIVKFVIIMNQVFFV